MASEAAGNREDVEQARRRFEEFRQAHAVRSRLPEELWATAAKLARRDGITATGRGPTEPAEVDGSIGASCFHQAAEVSTPASAGRECRARLRGTAGGQYGNGNQLCGGGGISQGLRKPLAWYRAENSPIPGSVRHMKCLWWQPGENPMNIWREQAFRTNGQEFEADPRQDLVPSIQRLALSVHNAPAPKSA
jgi:hypothetical protein